MMNFLKNIGAACVGLSTFVWCSVAFAADLSPIAPPSAKNNSLLIELSPEWKTSNGVWADDYLKLGYSYTFDNNIVWGASYQHTFRDTNSADQIETSLGYKLKSGALTITPSMLLGYGFGDQPRINPANNFDPEAYYAFAIAADIKLNDHFTWNAINARYRNAFAVTWITPKVSSGITYKIDGSNSVYANVGYAWKDTGKGLLGDKWNVAVGYKFAF